MDLDVALLLSWLRLIDWPSVGETSVAVGGRSVVAGFWIVALTPKIEKPLTRRLWSWKPELPPILNWAEPLIENVGVVGKLPFESGIEMLTLAVGTLTLT